MAARTNAKKSYIQITEARYSKMDDATFVKAFAEDHEDEFRQYYDNNTFVFFKFIPFFKANLTENQFDESFGDFEPLRTFTPEFSGTVDVAQGSF